MGNYRFRLSNIIPNSWFHSSIAGKRSKNRSIKTQPVTTSSSSSSLSSFPAIQQADDKRKSYYFTRELTVPNDESSPPNPQKNSSSEKQRPIRRKREQCVYKPKSKSKSKSNSSDSEGKSVSTNLIYEDHVYGKVDLAPIITKPAKKNYELGSGKWAIDGGRRSLSLKVVKDGGVVGSPMRKGRGTGSGYSPRVGVGNRVRIQGISGGRRSHGYRRSLSESMAVVKTSADPGRDFKESMVEMIRENKMKSCEDLEELLACYLSLNSDEYHDLIIKVFKQIWFESTNIRL